MNGNPYVGQFDQQVLCADPVELTVMLFDHLVLRMNQAREHLSSGNREERARAISASLAVVSELAHSLDPQQGGEVAVNLQLLYDFTADRLTQAHSTESDAALVEALQAMMPLRDAWHELLSARNAVPASGASANTELHEGFAVHA